MDEGVGNDERKKFWLKFQLLKKNCHLFILVLYFHKNIDIWKTRERVILLSAYRRMIMIVGNQEIP